MIQLVLVLMQVVVGVGEGGEGDGEGGKVGEGAGEEGGRDPERPRQHRSCGEAQPLKFRLLEPFCFRSSVLEPDLHLQKNAVKLFPCYNWFCKLFYRLSIAIEIQAKTQKDKETNQSPD